MLQFSIWIGSYSASPIIWIQIGLTPLTNRAVPSFSGINNHSRCETINNYMDHLKPLEETIPRQDLSSFYLDANSGLFEIVI